MCCAITIGRQKQEGGGTSAPSRAVGPPVEVPTSTMPSPCAGTMSASLLGFGVLRGARAAAPAVLNRTRSRSL